MIYVYVVLIEDRHADVDAEVYLDPVQAVERATELAEEYNSFPEDLKTHELSKGMIQDGWVLYISYSTESDSVRVLKREVK